MGLATFTPGLMALLDWLEESVQMSVRLSRLPISLSAVQTRYDDSLEILSSDWLLLLGIPESLIKDVQSHLS